VGKGEWAADARYASNTLRVTENPDSRHASHHPHPYHGRLVALLEDKAVPCGPINTIGDAFADPQVVARNLKVNQAVAPVSYAQAAPEFIASVASPLRLTDTPPVLRHAPPALGEHTDRVLSELGLDAAAIAHLRQTGVV
jgi:formyl-CoA transferase